MDARDERDLVDRCRSGDDAAFRELVERYKDLVYSLIARTVRRPDRIDDLAQEVFLRIHRGLPYFRGDARLSTWIFRIVANICGQERDPAATGVSLDDRDGPGGAIQPGHVDRAFGDFELRDRLDKAIERLSPQARLLVAAHYLRGVGYEELADALGIPLGTVKTQLYRAKRELRRLLADELG